MKFITKFFNLFREETWERIATEDADVTVYHYGFPWKTIPATFITTQSNKGKKKYFIVESEGVFKDKPYEVDIDTHEPKYGLHKL